MFYLLFTVARNNDVNKEILISYMVKKERKKEKEQYTEVRVGFTSQSLKKG